MLKTGLILVFFSIFLTVIMAGRPELQAVIEGNGLFTRQLYQALSKGKGNVFFSPISAHAVLSMAYQGSGGTTREAFTKALNVAGHQQAAEGYHDILNHLNNITGVQLLMANKIFVKEGQNFKPEFQAVTTKKFQSEVQKLNFEKSAESAKIINDWVEDKTQNKIKDLIEPGSLDASTRLVLVNAIYFKGTWANKFEVADTKLEKFYLNDVDSIDVNMMNKRAKFFYKEDPELDAKVLELPYTNPDVSLVIILPNKRNGIGELEKKLSGTDLTRITENMHKPEVILKLPKFKIETSIDLVDPLTQIGLGEIFTEKANFSNILDSPDQLYVSKAIQKAFIEVNEEGTEAAAATGLYFDLASLILDEENAEFLADHPFVILLRSTITIVDHERQAKITADGLPLFLGRISRPSE
ncbi:hypothetical protein ABEB36_011750 [Hypothenemus hampei]|uniref:Serpin domain-containing protein n=1 Tax=Hypothenemus hampei TaxID=57062 RepID=A0ABD1E950_HYPHA